MEEGCLLQLLRKCFSCNSLVYGRFWKNSEMTKPESLFKYFPLLNDIFINWSQVLLWKVCQSVQACRKERLRSLNNFCGFWVCSVDGSAAKMLIINNISRGRDLNCSVIFSTQCPQISAHKVFAYELALKHVQTRQAFSEISKMLLQN